MPGFPLSDNGCRQIEKVSRYLANKHIKAIYASPILRTKQTARIAASFLHVPITYSESLLELRSPVQGSNIKITEQMDRQGDTYHYPLHYRNGGETSEHLYQRMRRIIHKALHHHRGNILMVSHGDPLMVFSLREQGNPIDWDHAIGSYGHYIPKSGLLSFAYEGDRLVRATRVNY